MARKMRLAITIALLEATCLVACTKVLCRKFALKYCKVDPEPKPDHEGGREFDDDNYRSDENNGNDCSCDCSNLAIV